MVVNNYTIYGGVAGTISLLIIFMGLKKIYHFEWLHYYVLNLAMLILSGICMWSYFSSDFYGFNANDAVTILSFLLSITASCHIVAAFAVVADKNEK
jgi:hypothetical protein